MDLWEEALYVSRKERHVSAYSKQCKSVDLIEAAASELVSLKIKQKIRIGLVARICRSQSSKDDQFRQGRGSIPRFGIILLLFGI